LFEVQAEKTPDAPAVVFEDQRLTYRELNERSNQLAHCLLESGVGPEVLVGICAERSLEMVIGLLGILKAGGAYVPLDPAYPGERLAFMMEDADVPVLLIQEHLRDKLPGCRARVFCLDDPNLIKDKQIGNPGGSVTGHNLAYMIYTSGSTGRPKGAMNSHQGIRNRLLWMQEAYGLTHYDRVLQKTPFSFDVSVWEFFWPLMFGACLVMARPGGHQDSSYLVDVIRKQQITTIHFVPSMLQLFLGEQYLSECRSLRRVICSGEALPFELQRRFFACLNAELHNLYGPTEASVDVTSWACERKEQGRIVPIGYPIANIQTYILDKGLEPVPVGIAGELFLGGTGLGRGYLKRPDLTAEKFIPDLYGGRGSRIYRTGDLARWLPDGSIEYLGRLDHQVKIRGLRIELGEIEAVLMAHPGIREAVVTAREDVPGDKRLVAYVVPAGGAAPAGELRAYLKETLPDYMVPSAFAVLEVLPLSPNGKADRKALPAPDGIRPELESGYAAPRTLVEKTLTDIWGQVLRVDRVGIHDNFFNLGGHSLLATQVVSRIREVFQAEVSLRSFFDAPTIAELASIVERGPEPMYQSEIAGADAVAVSGYDREEGEI
jgi:amino acid adenylation domain-containing protein